MMNHWPGWPRRIATALWVIKLDSRAFDSPPHGATPGAWLYYLEPQLPARLTKIAQHNRDCCLRNDYPLDGPSQLAAAYRRYDALARRYRGWRGLTRFATFPQGALPLLSGPDTGWFYELSRRAVMGDFLGYHCLNCGFTGGPQKVRRGEWEEGTGRGRMWGDTVECQACAIRLASVPTGSA